jgi:hypothetical protein
VSRGCDADITVLAVLGGVSQFRAEQMAVYGVGQLVLWCRQCWNLMREEGVEWGKQVRVSKRPSQCVVVGCGCWVEHAFGPPACVSNYAVCVLCIQCGQPQCSQCTCACSVSCVFAASAVLCDVGSEGWYSLLPLTQPASELALQLRATPTQGWMWLDVEGLGRLHVLLS